MTLTIFHPKKIHLSRAQPGLAPRLCERLWSLVVPWLDSKGRRSEALQMLEGRVRRLAEFGWGWTFDIFLVDFWWIFGRFLMDFWVDFWVDFWWIFDGFWDFGWIFGFFWWIFGFFLMDLRVTFDGLKSDF